MPGIEESATKQEDRILPELKTVTELPLPKNWTYLVHGSNLGKPQWQGDGLNQLDSNEFVVSGMGLSVIDKSDAERSATATPGAYDTTRSYSRGKGLPLEIRVIFPSFYSRHSLDEQSQKDLEERYGSVFIKTVINLADQVQWKNLLAGRHPILPRGMKLIKLIDELIEDRGRVIQYIPEVLKEFYQSELSR